jgi:hypothetical protein
MYKRTIKMTVRIRVKQVKPVKEFSPVYEGKKLLTVLGCKVYGKEELAEVRKQFQELVDNSELELAMAKLEKLQVEGDKADESYYEVRKELTNRIQQLSESREVAFEDFYKAQIAYIKNGSLEIELEDGTNKDISVGDTRTAQPVESLWDTSDECLAVLLDTYLSTPSLRDSLISNITNIIFSIDTEDRVKNSK